MKKMLLELLAFIFLALFARYLVGFTLENSIIWAMLVQHFAKVENKLGI